MTNKKQNDPQDPGTVKNSVGDSFRGAFISIGEKSHNSRNEVRAYQTFILQKNPKKLLSQFNFRSLEFENLIEEGDRELEGLKPGQYIFHNPILKAPVTYLDGTLKTILPFRALNLTSLHSSNQNDNPQRTIAYKRIQHDFLKSTSSRYFNEPYTFGYSGCCWKVLKPNNLTQSESDSSANQKLDESFEFKMIAKVFDVTNVAPRIFLPSIWFINVGCNSSLDLHPFDQDIDDVVRCRWASQDEAGSVTFNDTDQPFLKLDSEKCEIEFDTTKFKYFFTNSIRSRPKFSIPIAIIIEDFQNDKLRSSMPAQFLVASLPSGDTGAGDVSDQDFIDNNENQTDADIDNEQKLAQCNLIPVLSVIRDLTSSSEQEPDIKRSFDIYEGGRNGNHITSVQNEKSLRYP